VGCTPPRQRSGGRDGIRNKRGSVWAARRLVEDKKPPKIMGGITEAHEAACGVHAASSSSSSLSLASHLPSRLFFHPPNLSSSSLCRWWRIDGGRERVRSGGDVAFVGVVGCEQVGTGSDVAVVGVVGLGWQARKWWEQMRMSGDVCEWVGMRSNRWEWPQTGGNGHGWAGH